MRRAGANPTDVEILDIVNKVGGESGNDSLITIDLLAQFAFVFIKV